jgi:hypothetical protein
LTDKFAVINAYESVIKKIKEHSQWLKD